jgi:hypothetical protein
VAKPGAGWTGAGPIERKGCFVLPANPAQDPDSHCKIDQRFPDHNRDHDPDQKPFRKNRGSFFRSKSDPDFGFEIDQRLKNRSQ